MIFPDNYCFEYKKSDHDPKDLVISVSSAVKPAFYGTNFNKNTLYIGDKSLSYYTKSADIMAAGLNGFFRKNKFERVVFLGVSKGGFGALLLSQLCSKINENILFKVLAFSPQVLLYPRDRALSFPSYSKLIAATKTDIQLEADLMEFGQLKAFTQENNTATVFFGGNNHEDSAEAIRLKGWNLERNGIPISGHLSHIPFVVDTKNPTALRSLLERAYSQSKMIGEIPASHCCDRDFEEMSILPSLPKHTDLINKLFER